MQNAEQSPHEKISVIARKALASSEGDLSKATEKMEKAVRANPTLFNELMWPLVHDACYDKLRSLVRTDREKIWTAPNYTQGGNGRRLHALASTLLDFPLPNGKRMRDASKADLVEAATFYGTQAKDMSHKARWLDAIAARVGRKKVGDVLSAEQLAKLQEEVK